MTETGPRQQQCREVGILDVTHAVTFTEVSVYPWKEPAELKARTINRVRTFLKRHQPSTAAR